MGMFNDNVGAGRERWTYKYDGRELVVAAQRLYTEFYDKEQAVRLRVAEYMKDMTIAQNDRRVEEAKRDIILFGTLKEQCEVFRHEFARNPNKTFDLGLGDVTFFGLAKK
jgi:hypothetical protein